MGSRYIPLGPFTYTAPGDLGQQRDTVLCNEILLRDKVGQAKVRGYYIPGKGFTFGRPNEKRDYTAADALRGWPGLSNTGKDKPKKQQGRDFMALNRAAISAGLVTAPEHYDYRINHDYRLKPPPDVKTRNLRNFPANMVFGMPSRPSTPMFDILEHKYQDKWIKQRFNHKQTMNEQQSKKKSQLLHYDTRATLLRTYQNPVDKTSPWQMPHFKNNAKPHLQTFRAAQSKEGAWQNFDLDQVSRKGTLGQGVYEAAKN